MQDFFGRDVSALRNKTLFLFDMDGTIYEDEYLFEGTKPLLETIVAKGARYIFITNNSSRSVLDYVAKLKRLGIETDKDHFFTSSQATILLLKEKYPNVKVYCQGTRSLIKELEEAGIDVTEEASDDVGLVLTGFDTELNFTKLTNTCFLLGRDLPYYATNPDLRCQTSFGYVPDCGSVATMLYNCTGKTPIYIGKPEPTMIDIVRSVYSATKEETVVIGDRLYTDIASAVNAQVDSICVLSGEATVSDIQQYPQKPSYVLRDVAEIRQAIL